MQDFEKTPDQPQGPTQRKVRISAYLQKRRQKSNWPILTVVRTQPIYKERSASGVICIVFPFIESLLKTRHDIYYFIHGAIVSAFFPRIQALDWHTGKLMDPVLIYIFILAGNGDGEEVPLAGLRELLVGSNSKGLAELSGELSIQISHSLVPG